MTKKQKSEASVDSDDLQALFDSIASAPAAEKAAPAPALAKADDGSGDNDDLQALFDSVSAEVAVPAEEAVEADTATSTSRPASGSPEAVFNRIGQMTRQVHDTLRGLSSDDALQDAVRQMPDARQRLSYISQMTEQAASRVLNATDIARPIQDKVLEDAQSLGAQWDKLFANELGVEEFKSLAGETRKFIGSVEASSKATNDQLLEIMMAQDFQDLTGQVIKRVVDLAQTLESQLLGILIEVTPPEKLAQAPESLMNGPVINSLDRDDVVTTQEQVDDLLDSLGF